MIVSCCAPSKVLTRRVRQKSERVSAGHLSATDASETDYGSVQKPLWGHRNPYRPRAQQCRSLDCRATPTSNGPTPEEEEAATGVSHLAGALTVRAFARARAERASPYFRGEVSSRKAQALLVAGGGGGGHPRNLSWCLRTKPFLDQSAHLSLPRRLTFTARLTLQRPFTYRSRNSRVVVIWYRRNTATA